ncbi:hypothetical protein, partial [Neochlamydia sp. TUME1]|uniref:hypothetical protein n=1 Tax=Neochlamydia sp. TUME1 TaxID=1478174 RepID=UPI0005806C78
VRNALRGLFLQKIIRNQGDTSIAWDIKQFLGFSFSHPLLAYKVFLYKHFYIKMLHRPVD